MALYTKNKINTQWIVNTLQDYIDHFTLYISNDVRREREIKSATERRKLFFHISPADCSFPSSVGAVGTGLFSLCFSLDSLVASQSMGQPSSRKHYSPFIPPALPVYLGMCYTVPSSGQPFITQETTSQLVCHLSLRWSFLALVWRAITFYPSPLPGNRRELQGEVLSV